MTRILVHVEGQTEERFVGELLAPHLVARGFASVRPRLMGNARQRERRGGARSWHAVRREIVNHLRQDKNAVATTMVDYYGMPQNGSQAWPGRSRAAALPFPGRAVAVESALAADVARTMNGRFDRGRFVPFVTMHEFEALLFSDCERFGVGIGRPDLARGFERIRGAFDNPEAIDDSPETAPSRRVATLMPAYQKPLHGTLAALEVGLETMRAECPHFAAWLDRLEALGARASAPREQRREE